MRHLLELGSHLKSMSLAMRFAQLYVEISDFAIPMNTACVSNAAYIYILFAVYTVLMYSVFVF